MLSQSLSTNSSEIHHDDLYLTCERWFLCSKIIRQLVISGFQRDAKSMQVPMQLTLAFFSLQTVTAAYFSILVLLFSRVFNYSFRRFDQSKRSLLYFYRSSNRSCHTVRSLALLFLSHICHYEKPVSSSNLPFERFKINQFNILQILFWNGQIVTCSAREWWYTAIYSLFSKLLDQLYEGNH